MPDVFSYRITNEGAHLANGGADQDAHGCSSGSYRTTNEGADQGADQDAHGCSYRSYRITNKGAHHANENSNAVSYAGAHCTHGIANEDAHPCSRSTDRGTDTCAHDASHRPDRIQIGFHKEHQHARMDIIISIDERKS
jgi:hypothetical protein